LGAILLTIGVLSTAGLVACTDDDPSVNPSTTTTGTAPVETSTPSSTAKPPTAPKAEPTPKSAEAFVKYFWDVHNYAYATLDLTAFNSISGQKCTFCNSTAEDIQELRESRTRTEGSYIRLTSVAAPPIKITTGIIVATVLSQDPGRVIHSDGTTREIPPMAESQAFTSLNWTGGMWLVDDVAIEKPGKSP
jgi:hypothetical protein